MYVETMKVTEVVTSPDKRFMVVEKVKGQLQPVQLWQHIHQLLCGAVRTPSTKVGHLCFHEGYTEEKQSLSLTHFSFHIVIFCFVRRPKEKQ